MPSATSNAVDTGRVTNRRELKFDTIDQVLEEMTRLADAERAGRLRHVGNWTLGQATGHLATWVEFAYSGTPLTPPLWVKWLVRLSKKKFLYGEMRAGVIIPKVPGGTLGTEPIPLDEALPWYRSALEKLRSVPPTRPNVVFGPLTHEQWIALNLRHAELHLSFQIPQ